MEFIKKNIFKAIGVVFVVFIIIFSISKIQQKSNSIAQVTAGNFDLNYKKIPYNSESIDITFSKKLDKSSITKDSFSISPNIDGEIVFKNGNTISYILKEKLEAGKVYSIFLSSDIKSKSGKNIEEFQIDLKAVGEAKVVQAFPIENLNNISENLIVLFNMPLIPLASLDEKDKLPCPVEINPAIDGKCKWTSGNVLEFSPEKHWSGATKYTVKIKNQEGLLYPLKAYKTEFSTPELNFFSSNVFAPTQGIKIRSNFPVTKEELEKNIKLEQVETKQIKSLPKNVKNNKTEIKNTLAIRLEQDESSENKFTIKLKEGNFDYGKNYNLKIQEGIKPKYGNINGKEKTFKLRTNEFLSNVEIFRNIYSKTGSLIDTQKYYYKDNGGNDNLLPKKDIFFKLYFSEEVPLNKNLFSFGGSKIKISYIEEEKEERIDGITKKFTEKNRKKIKLEILDKLVSAKNYSLKIDKELTKALKEDIEKNFKTSTILKISNIKFLDYSKTCIYFNNPVQDQYWGDDNNETSLFDNIEIEPKAKVSSVQEVFGHGSYENNQLRQQIRKIRNGKTDKELSYDQKEKINKLLLENGECPLANLYEHGYEVNTRLNPNTKYTIKIKDGLEDKYGNKINEYEKNDENGKIEVETKGIRDSDKYFYSSLSKDINVIPSPLPILANFQGINLEKAKIEICEMNFDGYFYYLNNSYNRNFSPNCIKESTAKTIDIKNKNWLLTNNVFDLEKDILGSDFSENFIVVRGSIDNFNRGKNWKGEGGYLDRQKEFRNLYIRSNLSLNFENGKNKKVIFASSIDGKEIVKDLNFEFYNRKKEKLNIDVKFNKETGAYEFKNDQDEYKKRIYYVIAKNKDYFGIINAGYDFAGNYDFKYTGGHSTSQKNYAYIYTDRPIYKPGDTVYFKGLVRNFNLNGYAKSDIKNGKIELRDRNTYSLIKSYEVKLDENSNFSGEFQIPKEVKLGEFEIRFFSKNQSYFGISNFWIEEYKKPTFKLEAQIKENKNDFLIGENVNFKIEPLYYFGGKMINTDGTYEITSQDYYFDAKDYSDYNFGKSYKYFHCLYWGECSYRDYYEADGELKIDENGEGKVNYKIPDSIEKGEKIYNFRFTVNDPDTKKQVTKTKSITVHNTDSYVGIKSPYFNTQEKGIKVSGITLDFFANPVSKNLELKLIRKEWKSVKKQGIDGVFYNENKIEEIEEKSIKVSSNSKGEFEKLLKTEKNGEYEIRAIYKGANGKEFISSIHCFVAGEGDYFWGERNNDTTDLIADKSRATVGEKVGFTLKSPVENGKLIYFIEKDDGILDYKIRDLTGKIERIEIELKEEFYPNFYIKAFLIGKEEGNPLPVYKRALSQVKVDTEFKRLNVSIKTNKNRYETGEKVEVEIQVKDANGNPVQNANGSLSIVDQSLLALKGNPKKNPYAFFYDLRRYLGVNSYISLKNLIEKLEVKDVSDGEKGGAGEELKGGDSNKKRGNFKDTAFWLSDFSTDENGIAKISSENLPDNLTTWVIEALVSTEDNKIGINYSDIITSKELLISDNLPRVFGDGDKVYLSPVIFNKSNKNLSLEVSLNGTNIETKENKKNLLIKAGEQETVKFENLVKCEEIECEFSKVNIKVEAKNGDYYDEIEKFLQIKDNSTTEAVSTVGETKDASFDEKIVLSGKEKKGHLEINYSPTILTSLVSGIDFLNRFPYGCSEQRTSAIMPNIYIKKLYDSAQIPFDLKEKMLKKRIDQNTGYKEIPLDEVIRNYLVEIKKFQNLDGGFSYWTYEGRFSSFHLSSYILTSISEIRDIGFEIDEETFGKTKKYLKDRFYKNQRENCHNDEKKYCEYSRSQRANAISAILDFDSKDYEAFKMWKLLKEDEEEENKNYSLEFKTEELKLLGKLLDIESLKDEEKEILKNEFTNLSNDIITNNLTYNPRGAFIENGYGNRIINTSNFVGAISKSEKIEEGVEQIIDQMNRWLISSKKDGTFGSTYQTMNVIKNLAIYLENSGELKDINFKAKLFLNNENIEEKYFNQENKLETYGKNISFNEMQKENNLNFTKEGDGSIYYDLSLNYKIPAKNVAMRDEGFFIEKKYYDYNEYRKIKSLKEKEYQQYRKGEIEYEELKYPKDIFEYINPRNSGDIGQILIVRNKIITPESRDQVALEGFIPAGAELINTNLDTENKNLELAKFFDHQEFRNDRFFGFKEYLRPGIYSFEYIIRLTHSGDYSIKPTRIFEFYKPEVFGRSAGEEFLIK